ncbi:hypothetical protein PCH70_06560 [Pseudomonas cichorii JBC1]|nr:hypothetical protein PCH70_06560 [Pseudomonas cichorii JBC1]
MALNSVFKAASQSLDASGVLKMSERLDKEKLFSLNRRL